jgi:hypothetical protein
VKRLGIVLLAACGDNATPSSVVHDGFLHDSDGRALIMRGANVSGSQKAPPYLDDKTPDEYRALRTVWGFNTIRFIMTWAAVEPAQGQFDDGYLDRVAERMQWAHDAGLSVVLDMHQDIYGEGFGFDGAPRWTCDESRYAAFVPQMALAIHDRHLEPVIVGMKSRCPDDRSDLAALQIQIEVRGLGHPRGLEALDWPDVEMLPARDRPLVERVEQARHLEIRERKEVLQAA